MLFEHVSVGAARCRLAFRENAVVGADLIDSNPAFEPYRALISGLYGPFGRVHARGTAETVAQAALTFAIYPAGHDEVVVVVEDKRFETTFQSNAAALAIAHQRDLRIVDVNPRWLDMFSLSRDEVIGKTAVELGLISENAGRTRLAEHRQYNSSYDTEIVARTRTGQRIVVLASARPIELAEGPCTLTTLIDITGRKHAEAAFEVAFNASPAGMVLSEVATDRIVAINNKFMEATGFTREALVGRLANQVEIIRRPSRAELLAEISRTGHLHAVEVELACRDGSTTPTLLSTELVTLNEDIHRLSVFIDISARKLVERRLLTQHEIGRTLAAATELDPGVPSIIEALCRGERWDCGALWLPIDEGGLLCRGLWYEPALETPATLALATFTRGVVPVDNAGLLGRVLQTGEAEQMALDTPTSRHGMIAAAAGMRCFLVFPILRGTDVLGVVALAARSAPSKLDASERSLFDSIGRMLGLFVQRMHAESSLRQLNIELEHRVNERTHELATTNRDLEAFASSVSHDLRAPLRAIQGYARILVEDHATSLPTEAVGLLGRIEASGVRMRELIVDLLAYARLGRDELHRSEVDLDGMVRSVSDELRSSRNLGDRLTLTIHPLGLASADAALLRAVWTNLIDNALKYARNRDRIVVEIGVEARGSETLYYVRDNGVGFAMAHASRLFEMFERLHPETEFEGTGVGLANVRRIVERHHGRISATSEVGVGSRFEFTLGS